MRQLWHTPAAALGQNAAFDARGHKRTISNRLRTLFLPTDGKKLFSVANTFARVNF
jgi:hypothetical protein